MRRLISLLVLALLVGVSTQAQGQQPTLRPPASAGPAMGQATTPPAMAPQAPRAETPRAPMIGSAGNLQMAAATNIRLNLVITDTFTGTPVTKSVSMLVLSGNSGMIRTTNTATGSAAMLNVDAVAAAYQSGQISTRITFEYSPASVSEGPMAGKRPPSLHESITLVLQDGKAMVISQSADPATDRKVTAELTATILK